MTLRGAAAHWATPSRVRRQTPLPLKREGFWFGAPPEGWVFPLDWLPRNA